jgi:hypothetical protein
MPKRSSSDAHHRGFWSELPPALSLPPSPKITCTVCGAGLSGHELYYFWLVSPANVNQPYCVDCGVDFVRRIERAHAIAKAILDDMWSAE